MTKETLKLIEDILNQISVPLKADNFMDQATALDKAKKEVKEELNGTGSSTKEG